MNSQEEEEWSGSIDPHRAQGFSSAFSSSTASFLVAPTSEPPESSLDASGLRTSVALPEGERAFEEGPEREPNDVLLLTDELDEDSGSPGTVKSSMWNIIGYCLLLLVLCAS